MSILQRAIHVLTDAEAALKRLIGEAAERGEYSSVETLARWANGLGAMSAKEQQAVQQNKAAAPSDTQGPVSTAITSKRKTFSRTSGHSKRRKYPVFVKSGDTLVKIAWSKSSKSEYHHKSPRMVVRVLADTLTHRARSGAIVSMDTLLPLKADDGSEIPDYQAYVSLAWLRQIGAVEQNGRQGYTVKKPDELRGKIDAAWASLPEAAAR